MTNFNPFYLGRLDIFPGDIEECLLKHSNVAEAIAFGISINDFEQEICAWAKLKSNDLKTSPEDLIQFCLGDDKLANYHRHHGVTNRILSNETHRSPTLYIVMHR